MLASIGKGGRRFRSKFWYLAAGLLRRTHYHLEQFLANARISSQTDAQQACNLSCAHTQGGQWFPEQKSFIRPLNGRSHIQHDTATTLGFCSVAFHPLFFLMASLCKTKIRRMNIVDSDYGDADRLTNTGRLHHHLGISLAMAQY